ncbi:MAG: type II toxin-antitoxin system VapC family toxin [Alphaproteobacteria bacterium]
MRVLIDTHVVLDLIRQTLTRRRPEIARLLSDPATVGFVSVASLWETAIKTRLRKLDPGMPLDDIAGYLEALGLAMLPIEISHVITAVDPEPLTRDPFDRLLLAQCQIEDLRLVTLDRALAAHPLAAKAK